MALLLWVAGALAFVAGAPQLGWAIWAVILINGAFSFWQEFRAERTLEALAGNLPPLARVWRDGQLRAVQRHPSSVAFTTIVLGQVGVLMACRSAWRPSWRMLREPNPLLWWGVVSELLLLPSLGAIFALGPFPLRWLPLLALAAPLIVLVDDLRKGWLRRRPPRRGVDQA